MGGLYVCFLDSFHYPSRPISSESSIRIEWQMSIIISVIFHKFFLCFAFCRYAVKFTGIYYELLLGSLPYVHSMHRMELSWVPRMLYVLMYLINVVLIVLNVILFYSFYFSIPFSPERNNFIQFIRKYEMGIDMSSVSLWLWWVCLSVVVRHLRKCPPTSSSVLTYAKYIMNGK